ncbi:hypothetical protein INT44_002962 [Umbelopsis vinacea]|uniref:DH domain-containing protein n=1 Tax=Umbelopsis vinacea TaxID=44442 RepID=A0A8H7Q8J3_9FUNG|nr:hypothetical protein INT44_002962 [Umbelopsis vinacea]
MTTDLRSLESVLSKHGYVHSWKLLKQKSAIPALDRRATNDSTDALQALLEHPVCQTVDIVVDGCRRYRTPAQYQLYQQFLSILGSRSNRNEISMDAIPTSPSPSYYSQQFLEQQQYDPEQRMNSIQEFISSEETYVKNLITVVDVFVRPLRSYSQDRMNSILKPFNCTKIFLNIDQILSVNEGFLEDLRKYQKNPETASFGAICDAHIANFDCYTRYLHEHRAAGALHTKEYKVNQSYRSFLIKAKDHPDAKRKQLQDLLVEPVQRISRYTMLLKEIIKNTPPEHHDHASLISALSKAGEIANMADDNRTRLARMFLNLYNSIKGSPCSLVNQSRRLIHHVDATELDIMTRKPLRPVTILVFTDKVLVASRPSYFVSGSDLCGIDNDITSPNGSTASFLAKKAEKTLKRDRSLKFKGWSDIDQVELFNGPASHASSFLLRVNSNVSSSGISAASSFEEYFSEQSIRMYSIAPPKDENEMERNTQSFESQRDSFYSSFHYSKAQYLGSSAETTYHHTRSSTVAYSNIYNFGNYASIKRKSNITIVYVEEGECAVDRCLAQDDDAPWLVGLVYADIRGFRFSIRSKLHLGAIRERTNSMPLLSTGSSRADEGAIDFESVFWNNVQASEIKLRHSNLYQDKYATINSIISRKTQDGRPRSLSKTRSIPTIGKLFGSTSSSTANSQNSLAPVKSTSSSTVSSVVSAAPSANQRRPRLNSISGPVMDCSQPPPYSQSASRSSCSANSLRSYTSTESDMWSSGTSISSSTSTEYMDYLTPKPPVVRSSRPVRMALPTVPQGYAVTDSRPTEDYFAEDNQRGRRKSRSSITSSSITMQQQRSVELDGTPDEQKKLDHGLEDMQKYLSSIRSSLSKVNGQSEAKWTDPEWSPRRPESRSSVASSTATNNSASFSNRASRSSTVSSDNSIHSTRSSLSLDDMDYQKDALKADLDSSIYLPENQRRSPVVRLASSISHSTTPDSVSSENVVSKSMSKLQNDYVGKWQELFDKCSTMAQEIEDLTETLRDRNNEVTNLRKLYRDTADENKILYEKFNEELEDIANVLEDRRYKSDGFGSSRPSHPTPEGQLRRKLKVAIKERYYWQQKSGELTREIESLRKGIISP